MKIDLIAHLKCRTILRPGFAMIVDPGRCNIRMPQLFLHFGDIRAVIQHIGRGGSPHHVRSHVFDKDGRKIKYRVKNESLSVYCTAFT